MSNNIETILQAVKGIEEMAARISVNETLTYYLLTKTDINKTLEDLHKLANNMPTLLQSQSISDSQRGAFQRILIEKIQQLEALHSTQQKN